MNILIGALILGFGWRTRGDHGDVLTPILLFVLFLGFIFTHKKLNPIVFGLMALSMKVLRRGWGTFVGQTTGKLEGHDYVRGTNDYIFYSVSVPAWQGFFWLFIVGVAWSSIFACLIAYQFSDKEYHKKDVIICIILFIIGMCIGFLIAIISVPYIAPDAYYKVYVKLKLDRNYISMRDNLAYAIAIIPVLLYLIIKKKDYYLVKIAVFVMVIFGFAFSFSDLWQLYGRTHQTPGFPYWELWEYYSGFIAGALIVLMLYLIPEKRWIQSDLEFPVYPIDTKGKKIIVYIFAHLILYAYTLAENVSASIDNCAQIYGINITSSIYVFPIIFVVDLVLYWLYQQDKLGNKLQEFKTKELSEKCLIILIILIPIIYILNILNLLIGGSFQNMHLMYWVNTFSVLIVESFLIYKKFQGRR